MERFTSVLLFLAITSPGPFFPASVSPPTARYQGPALQNNSSNGVVVEKVLKGYSFDKAGIQAGDLLVSWSRGGLKGEIESPLDLFRLEVEQGSQAGMVLHGFRDKEPRSWTVGIDNWQTQTRPNFEGALLRKYLESTQTSGAGDLPEASQRLRALAGEPAAAQPPWLRAWIVFRSAEMLAEAGKLQEAGANFHDAVREASQSSPGLDRTMYIAFSSDFLAKNDSANGEKYAREFLERFADGDQKDLLTARAMYGTCIANWARGELSSAEQFCLQALGIAERLAPESRETLRNLSALGNIAWRRGDLAKAEDYQRRALESGQRLAPGNPAVSAVLLSLGLVASDRGDFARAENYFKQALTVSENSSTAQGPYTAALNNLGELELKRGNLAAASQYLRRSLERKERVSPGGMFLTTTLNNLGEVALALGKFDEAEDWERRALAIQEKYAPEKLGAAESLQVLGEIAGKRGKWSEAEGLYRHAVSIREKIAPGSALHAESLASLASVMAKLGRDDEAARFYAQALDALEGQAARLGGTHDLRAGFRARHAAFYREYISLLIRRQQPELAFHVLERARARSLLETLAESHVDIRTGVDAALLERQRLLEAEISARSDRRAQLLSAGKQAELQAVNQEISGLIARLEEADSQIRASSPAYAALVQPKPLSASEIQKYLPPDTTLLEYLLGEESSYVWVLTSDSLHSYKLGAGAEIEELARRVHELLTARNQSIQGESPARRAARLRDQKAGFQHAAAALGRMVLGPVAEELKSGRLIIVSDGALQYIPIAVLPVPQSSRSGRPMVLDHEIINLPSASALVALRQRAGGRKRPARELAVVADPVFSPDDRRLTAAAGASPSLADRPRPRDEDDSSAERLTRSAADMAEGRDANFHLSRLLFSRQEAQSIMATAAPGKAVEAVDFEATRQLVLGPELADYRIIHLATHGLINSRHPELSGLVFSLVDKSGRPQNGFLDLKDIYNLNLSADLVVLSACETGLGKEIAGEGLIGLTRGFMYAGATQVIASLWNVSDNATAELMRRFYQAMLHDKLSPSAALRRAQVEMLKQPRWSDPYYWGAFVVHGE